MFYLFSDGFADQFGGDKNKRIGKAQFREKFQEIASLPVDEQKQALAEFKAKRQKDHEQIDDVLVI